MNVAERAAFLREEIERHNRLYYVFDAPEIGDTEYDRLGLDDHRYPILDLTVALVRVPVRPGRPPRKG